MKNNVITAFVAILLSSGLAAAQVAASGGMGPSINGATPVGPTAGSRVRAGDGPPTASAQAPAVLRFAHTSTPAVTPVQNPDDTRLTLVVKNRLANDRDVSVRVLNVGARNGIVLLSGSVALGEDRDRAKETVTNTPGVVQVIDKVYVGSDAPRIGPNPR